MRAGVYVSVACRRIRQLRRRDAKRRSERNGPRARLLGTIRDASEPCDRLRHLAGSESTCNRVNPYTRARRTLVCAFVVYGVLVAANLGEFWPFSIYPMFSQGGNPWSRSVVRDVTHTDSVAWENFSAAELPGEPYPLLDYGVDPIDLSNFLSKSQRWNDQRVNGLRKMFATHELNDRRLLVLRVNGRITPEDSVIVEFVPYALLAAESTLLNEALPR